MDKKLLDALNNLSFAFEELAKTLAKASLDKDKSATSTALSQTKIEKKLIMIDKGVKKLQADNQKILKNQEQLLKLAQQKKAQKGPLDDAEKPIKKSKIKDGLQTIMLIAVGVLAIGLAFKIIGKVNILSVIALSIALPILAFAFDKIGRSKNLDPKKMKSVILPSLLIMSLAIAGSSWILQLVKPVGIFKLFTAILISAAFVGMSHALPKLTKGFNKISFMGAAKFLLMGPILMVAMSAAVAYSSHVLGFTKPVGIFKLFTAILISVAFSAIAMGLPRLMKGFNKVSFLGAGKFLLFGVKIMVALSLAIALSSRVLGFVKPVGIFKLFTAILIAAAFGAIGFGLGKILEGFRKSKLSKQEATKIAPLLPIVFLGLALAIVGASRLFQKIKPVGLFKLITAALIGLVFIPLSYALVPLARAMKRITKKQAMLMPVVLVLLALAIMVTSHIFKMTATIDFGKLKNIAAISVLLLAITFVFAKLVPAISKLKPTDLLKGGLVIIGIAVIVMVTSHILNVGAYENYPSLMWILGVAATIAAFALGALAIGSMVFGPQALVVLAGLAAILVISAVVMATSHILNAGAYEKYPSITWNLYALGTIMAFAVLAAGIGAFAQFVVVGGIIIVAIAYAITLVATILASGKYDKYPSLEWIVFGLGTITAFGLLAMGVGIFAPFVVIGTIVILLICASIILVDKILASGTYDKFPTLEWAASSFGAITAFAALAASLAFAGIFAAIGIPSVLLMSATIVAVSKILAKGQYELPGMAQWVLSTVLLFTTFVPILGVLAVVALANSVAQFFGSNPFGAANAMLIQISETIVEVSHTLAKGNYKGGPTLEWAQSVALALGAFSPIYGMLVNSKVMEFLGVGGIGPDDFNLAIRTIIGGIKFAARTLAGSVFQEGGPSEKWAKGVGTAIGAFAPVYEILSKSQGWFASGPTPEEYRKAIWIVSQGIVDAADFFAQSRARGSFDLKGVPSEKWGKRVGAAISAFTPALEFITKNASFWSGADPEIITKAIRATSWAIVESSIILQQGKFTPTVTVEWAKGVGESIKQYVETLEYTKDKIWDTVNFMVAVSGMVDTSRKFGMIAYYLNGVKPGMFATVFSNVIMYGELAKWLTKSDVDTWTVYQAVDSMTHMARGYSALGTAIKKLNSDLEELDIEKLNALKSLNASVILISLMDPKNFKEMMEELEDKGGVLIDALNDLESKEGEGKDKKKGKGAPSPKVNTGGKKEESAQKTMTDLYTIMESVDQKLAAIAKTSDKMSKYVDEIRGDDPMIRRK